jgi:hypothetical protein
VIRPGACLTARLNQPNSHAHVSGLSSPLPEPLDYSIRTEPVKIASRPSDGPLPDLTEPARLWIWLLILHGLIS